MSVQNVTDMAQTVGLVILTFATVSNSKAIRNLLDLIRRRP